MQVFRNKQTHKQTTQAIVIVLLNDASLKWLWKRANPESFKTWYQTWGVVPISADTLGPCLDPDPKARCAEMTCYISAGATFRLEVQNEPPGYSFPTCGPQNEPRRGWEGGSLQRNRTQASQPRSAQLKQTFFFFFLSFLVFAKNLDDKEKDVFGFF